MCVGMMSLCCDVGDVSFVWVDMWRSCIDFMLGYCEWYWCELECVFEVCGIRCLVMFLGFLEWGVWWGRGYGMRMFYEWGEGV